MKPIQTIISIILIKFSLVAQTCLADANNSSLCPGHPSLTLSDSVRILCHKNMPESRSECELLISDLSNGDNLSIQQRFDRGTAYQGLSLFERNPTRHEKLIKYAIRDFKSIQDEDPSDISSAFNLSFHLTSDESLRILTNVLNLVPDCINIRKILLEDLNYHPRFLNDSNITKDKKREITQNLISGYELTKTKVGKLQFAKMLFVSILESKGYNEADAFRRRVLIDLDFENLTYNNTARTENLNMVCDYSAFHLQLTKYCIRAIRQSLFFNIEEGIALDENVLEAIRKLGIALTQGEEKPEQAHPGLAREYDYSQFPFFPQESAKYAIEMADILTEVPYTLRTTELYDVGFFVMSNRMQIEFLEQLLKIYPANVDVQTRLQYARK